MAMELPYVNKEEYDKENPEERAEKCFNAAIENFKRKSERMATTAQPNIEYIYQ